MATFSDAFARADGDPGANWNQMLASTWSISSGELARTGSFTSGVQWATEADSDDQYSEWAYSTPVNGTFTGPCILMPAFVSGGLSSQGDWYCLLVSGTGPNFNWSIRRKDNASSGTTTLTSDTVSTSAGDVVRLEVDGTDLVAKHNGTEVLRAAMSGAPLTVGGRYVGLQGTAAAYAWDDFEGGDLGAATSELAGTVAGAATVSGALTAEAFANELATSVSGAATVSAATLEVEVPTFRGLIIESPLPVGV